MAKAAQQFNVVQRYRDGLEITAYQIKGSGGQRKVTREQLAFLCGKGQIGNAKAQITREGVIFSGVGCELKNMPTVDDPDAKKRKALEKASVPVQKTETPVQPTKSAESNSFREKLLAENKQIIDTIITNITKAFGEEDTVIEKPLQCTYIHKTGEDMFIMIDGGFFEDEGTGNEFYIEYKMKFKGKLGQGSKGDAKIQIQCRLENDTVDGKFLIAFETFDRAEDVLYYRKVKQAVHRLNCKIDDTFAKINATTVQGPMEDV